MSEFLSLFTEGFFYKEILSPGLFLFVFLAPLWAPVLLGILAWEIHRNYKQAKYIGEKILSGAVLFEILIPRQINRTPLAMELVTQVFFQPSPGGNKWKVFWEGNVPPWFSLEIASFGGDIHFYVWSPKFFKNHVENQIYSQYPEVVIKEVEDYTKEVDIGQPNGQWELRGWDFQLAQDDPLPIKTYVDYGLDQQMMTMKDMPSLSMQKVDPMTPLLEILGSIDSNDQVWIQILVRAPAERHNVADKKKSWLTGEDRSITNKNQKWTKAADALIKELMEKQKDGKLPPGGMDKIKAIEKSKSKMAFDCGIRALYLTKKYDVVDPDTGETKTKGIAPDRFLRLLGLWKSFSDGNLNGLKQTRGTSVEYWWQDPFKKKVPKMIWQKFDAYRRRSWFWPPYKFTPFILTSEELATLFHLPGQVAETPSLRRIESRSGKPPINLPT